MQVHQMVLQYMDMCSLSAEAQAMLDLKEANKAEMVTPATAEPPPKAGASSRRIRSPAQPQGIALCRKQACLQSDRNPWIQALTSAPTQSTMTKAEYVLKSFKTV